MKLSRRMVLRGAGGLSVALPLLSLDARAEPAPPRRFVFVYVANGVDTPYWFPSARSETDFSLQPVHAALEPFKSRCLWMSGVDLKVAVNGPGEMHQRGLGGLLTGHKIDTGDFVGNDGTRAGWALGRSLDQELVQLIGRSTRIPSLQLGVNVRERDVSGALSYAGARQPLLSQNDPRQTFRTLFLDAGAPTDELSRLRARRASVLDAVLGQLNLVKARVGAAERQRLEEHTTRVRELEQRVTALPPGSCPAPSQPAPLMVESENAMPDVARLQVDLLALAFQCDLTRVATLMFSDAKNHIGMPFLGIGSSVHNISHYSDADDVRRKLGDRDRWAVGQMATLLDKLSRLSDAGGGSVLDSSLVWFGSELSKGNVHAHDDMPFILAGGAPGWRMGRFVRFAGAPPHNNLLVSILQAFGGTQTSFGNPEYCSGPLAGLA